MTNKIRAIPEEYEIPTFITSKIILIIISTLGADYIINVNNIHNNIKYCVKTDYTYPPLLMSAFLLLAGILLMIYLVYKCLTHERTTPVTNFVSLLFLYCFFILTFAVIYGVTGIVGPEHGIKGGEFLQLVYFSSITTTTVGYGEYSPCPGSRPWAGIQASIGFFSLPFLIAFFWNSVGTRKIGYKNGGEA